MRDGAQLHMLERFGLRRWAAISGILVLLAGGAALWLASSAGKVQATATPPKVEAAGRPGEEADELLFAPAARPRSREEQRFARADRDDDGVIVQAEYLAQRRRNYDKLDANGDGVLQFEEYAASGIAKFAKADADGDGRLIPEEFATTAPRPKAKLAKAAADCPPQRAAQQNGDEDA